ncbi:hypothetical protein [Marinospirillum perlucidum]|uniref:hypothetical protein n=1 Tax=Marinospirillum perlucidum TaxID=1982602 RepID=UPI000DF47018|nr:hypothetical protein [Marinospirillum perlucidum]
MSLPTFIAVEGAAEDEESFPVSIAWSLSDGSIKQALIQPDEAWEDEEASALRVNELDLEFQGYAPTEIIREMEYDQDDDAYYVAHLHPQEAWMLKLFEAADKEIGFQLIEAAELYEDRTSWEDAWRESLDLLGLDATRAEDQVRALLEAHVQLTGDYPEAE